MECETRVRRAERLLRCPHLAPQGHTVHSLALLWGPGGACRLGGVVGSTEPPSEPRTLLARGRGEQKEDREQCELGGGEGTFDLLG